jgi:hypothetical protein
MIRVRFIIEGGVSVHNIIFDALDVSDTPNHLNPDDIG